MVRSRILLADDHLLVMEGLRKLLEAEHDLVGTVEDGIALVDMAKELEPDVILLDISIPMLNGIEAARKIKKLLPECKLIFVTMHGDSTYVIEAFRAGASGYLLKRSAASELNQAIRAVLNGQQYLSPLVTKDVLNPLLEPSQDIPARLGTLTARQREVLQLVAEGRSAKEIANILKISVKTVEFHKSQIMEHVGLRTTAELTKYAISHGIVSS
jgi:DNA-binding NarL/FixJ family response regulator